MKKIVFVLVLVFLSRAAYAVPTGCFITTYGSSCYSGYFSSYDCEQYNMTSYNFGSYVKSMCDYVNSVESVGATCLNTLSTVIAQRDSAQSTGATCVSTLTDVATQRDNANALVATTEQSRQQRIAYAGSRDKLIKRLYKACGSKCKRLK